MVMQISSPERLRDVVVSHLNGVHVQEFNPKMKTIEKHADDYAQKVAKHWAEEELVPVGLEYVGVRTQNLCFLKIVSLIAAV